MCFQWVFTVYNMLLEIGFFAFRLIILVKDKMKFHL
ncbi:putative membrane protein (plasmid) [Bacillus thuringiensis serovar kurstaki]|uniref:Uncharacterized protein n=2 Tax=Bacillus cereus group TaxID=86661 RepID=A0A9W5Q9G8_BACCE|nr:putative membrane protein [Bacillus thuringiensis serovar kurstaki]EJV72070.1 hypothetical protein IG1_05971 [Bacillus cereus HD73]EOP13913.1 hypothetical protein IGG_06894 [Bacillus cereus HuB13-1]EOP49231.1 hypothetical protein IGU_06899 [Bacillus cereus ISP2954]EOP78693.1 hypothetical protein IES_06601 [Bacillus cereus BMG1.7]ERH96562.1 hypothetical protein BTCBT_007291 [Bacillus thuringiensis T01-328]KKB27507.1 hypothetical protein Btm27_05602 [Bacillus thuringiensis serovar mexicanens